MALFIGALDRKLQTIDPKDTICPVSLNSYSKSNPPYLLPCCHHVSYNSLEELEIFEAYDSQSSFLGRYMECPECRGAFTHCQLDFSFLDLVILKEEVQKGFQIEEVLFLQPLTKYHVGTFPVIFQPRGGILSNLEKIKEIHSKGIEKKFIQ
jgi:hypothetical protein